MNSTEIGLLLCDHLDPDITVAVGDLSDLFPAAFEPAGLKLRIYEVTKGELPQSPDECRGWITSGSRFSAYDDEPWIADLSKFIVEAADAQVPHAGICFGHQLIAQSLGGRVERAEVGWGVGAKEFEVVDPAPWMTPESGSFKVLVSHQDQVTELPVGAQTLATSTYCPVGAYRLDSHVFCIQGHPEFVPELVQLLVERRRSRLGDEVADAALESLRGPLDQNLLVGWIVNFFDSTAAQR